MESQNREKKMALQILYHCRRGLSQLVCFLERGGGFVQLDSGQTVCSLARRGLLPLHALLLQSDLL